MERCMPKWNAHLVSILMLVGCAAMAAPRGVMVEGSEIVFRVKEMGVPVPGKFKRFEANIDIDPLRPDQSNASLRIDIGSLTTGNDEADAIAVDANWLDKRHAPFATFKTSAIRALSPGHFEATGSLNLRNKERVLTLQFTTVDQADGKTLVHSTFNIDRSTYGIGAGEWNEPGIVDEKIEVEVRLLLASPANPKISGTGLR